jgi:hypothetical protein
MPVTGTCLARLDGLAANAADNVCFQAGPQGGQRADLEAMRRARLPRNKVSKNLGNAKLTDAAERINLRFGLDGPSKFWHTEFRTALLSYLWKRNGWIWRMVCAGPAFVASIRVS